MRIISREKKKKTTKLQMNNKRDNINRNVENYFQKKIEKKKSRTGVEI